MFGFNYIFTPQFLFPMKQKLWGILFENIPSINKIYCHLNHDLLVEKVVWIKFLPLKLH